MATQVSITASPVIENSPAATNSTSAAPPKAKKKLIRRVEKDRSAIYRRSFQGAFLLLNLWIGAQFYSWV
ncbi:MAG TPA: hypothetical protein VFI45_15950, partial [Candidatus Acidoferrum sp.]|nr:hypothetical protein [Candidatus Acidoferrum sp.]